MISMASEISSSRSGAKTSVSLMTRLLCASIGITISVERAFARSGINPTAGRRTAVKIGN